MCMGAIRDSRASIQEYFHKIESFTLVNNLWKVAVIKKKKDLVAVFQLAGLPVSVVLTHTILSK